jgi:hypothetical protein
VTKTPRDDEGAFGCEACGADPTHIVEDAPALYCSKCRPDGATELCQACRPHATDRNHPPGMIFVGWGHGWQPCQRCGGSGLERTAEEAVSSARGTARTLATFGSS